jgi:uncharacterized protein
MPAASVPPAAPLRIAISGASGFVGRALARALVAGGHDVRRLVRQGPSGVRDIAWNPQDGQIDRAALEDLDAVVHLAGASIARRWTRAHRRRIRDSRVDGTRLLATTLAALARPPRVLISASAIGVYGNDRGDEPLDETSALGTGFLADVGREWEASAAPAVARGIRVVHPRFGVILGTDGGALPKMLLPFRLGLGGRLGSGRQWMSWIAIGDVVRALRWLIDAENVAGPVNVVAPHPIRNADFTRSLGRVLRRPTIAVVPAVALDIALGAMGRGTLLASQHVVPRRLAESGFTWEHPELDPALRALLGRG